MHVYIEVIHMVKPAEQLLNIHSWSHPGMSAIVHSQTVITEHD